MELRHKQVKLRESEITLKSLIGGQPFEMIREEIINAGKINHKISGSFHVQNNASHHSVKFFILTDRQFVEWVFLRATTPGSLTSILSKNTVYDPEHYIYSSKTDVTNDKFEFPIEKENVLYFIFDNSFSTFSSKKVSLSIWEEWDESILPIDVVTTTPPKDTSVEEIIQKMMLSAKNEIKILSPYIDMYFIKTLLQQHDNGIKIILVTRGVGERNNSKENKQALTFIQEKLGENHKINPFVHSRMIIQDEINALVSSVDLTENSLKSLYNAGIILSDPPLVQKLISYFNQTFRDSESWESSNSNKK